MASAAQRHVALSLIVLASVVSLILFATQADAAQTTPAEPRPAAPPTPAVPVAGPRIRIEPTSIIAIPITIDPNGPVSTIQIFPECGGRRVTIIGTPGDDDLVGTPGNDVILGLQGNDRIYGLGGDDYLCGGLGNDTIVGGQGFDVMFGAQGHDVIYFSDSRLSLIHI